MAQRVIPCAVTGEYVSGDGVTLGAAGSHDDVYIELDFRAAGPQWTDTTRRVIWTDPTGTDTQAVILGIDSLAKGYTEVYLTPVPAAAKSSSGWCEMVVQGVTVSGDVETQKVRTEPSRFRVLPASGRICDDNIPATVGDQLQAEIDAIKDPITGVVAQAEKAAKEAEQFTMGHIAAWLDAHPEATTTVQDGALTAVKFSPALQLLTLKDYATPEMYGAVGDGVTDDSSAIQQAMDSGYYAVLFGPKEYVCKNITLPDNMTLFVCGASIVTPAENNFVFTATGKKNITVIGGTYQRMNTDYELVKGDDHNVDYQHNGVFLFTNCDNVTADGLWFKNSMTMANLKFVSCRNVDVIHCVTEQFHGDNITFYNDCENVKVSHCKIRNGVSMEGHKWIYPIATGFTDYINAYKGVINCEFSDNVIENCDWEGIDSHGGRSIKITNNHIKNCNRAIVCYEDERPQRVSGYEWGDILIENNYVEEDTDVVYAIERTGSLVFTAAFAYGRVYNNITLRGNTFINPYRYDGVYNGQTKNYGIVAGYGVRQLKIIGNYFRFDEADPRNPSSLFRLWKNYDCEICDNVIEGHSATTFIIMVDCSSVKIKNNSVYSHPSISAPTALCSGTTGSSHSHPRPAYMDVEGNKGDFQKIIYSAQTRLLRGGELRSSAYGVYDGYQMGSTSGLRQHPDVITNPGEGESYEDIASQSGSVEAGNLQKVLLSGAHDKVIPGMAVKVTIGGVDQTTIISDVMPSYFLITDPVSAAGTATITFPKHTKVNLFASA